MPSSWADMVSALPAKLQQWFWNVQRRSLTTEGTVTQIARSNLVIFDVDANERKHLRREDIEGLLRALAAFWRELIPEAGLMMYAWVDEMAGGQLRVSACPARDIQSLPFSCKLRQVNVADIADLMLSAADSIPYRDLEFIEPGAVPSSSTPDDFVLDVWAQAL